MSNHKFKVGDEIVVIRTITELDVRYGEIYQITDVKYGDNTNYSIYKVDNNWLYDDEIILKSVYDSTLYKIMKEKDGTN